MTIDRTQFASRQRTMPDHLANLDRLTPGSLKGAKFAVVEIADAVIVDARRDDDKTTGEPKYEPALVLRYKEFPTRVHWLNKAGVNILCDVFGEEESAWVGNRIPIQVKEGVKNPKKNQKQDMVWIANADEWERLFAEDVERRETFARSTQPSASAQAARAASQRSAPRSE